MADMSVLSMCPCVPDIPVVQPGQKIVQTRRSIDFDPSDPLLMRKGNAGEEGTTAAIKTLRTQVSPAFIIIGMCTKY